MKRVLPPFALLLAFVLLQGQMDPTVRPQKPIERVRVMEESNVDSLLPTTGAASLVNVVALEGVPAEPRGRAAFLKGFRDAFREGDLATERVAKASGRARPSPALHNRFRLAEAEDDRGAWTARVKLEWFAPPPDTVPGQSAAADSLARVYPGLGVRVGLDVAEPPDPGHPDEARPPVTGAVSLRFPQGHVVDARYWQLAGRQVGFVLLETLSHRAGELAEDQRLLLEDTRRVPPPADAPAPRR